MKKIITYGTFDLLHQGHINILQRAKAMGDYLIVGVTSENYDEQRGKLNVMQSLVERIENVRKTGLADQIIVEEYLGQKIQDIQKYDVDTFVIGSDWTGKFDYLKEYDFIIYYQDKLISTNVTDNITKGQGDLEIYNGAILMAGTVLFYDDEKFIQNSDGSFSKI